jgi:hypothetical protein
LARNVQELAPLLDVGRLIGAVGNLLLEPVRLRLAWPVDKLEDEGSASDDTGATRKAVIEWEG